jgi:hypothetical protein
MEARSQVVASAPAQISIATQNSTVAVSSLIIPDRKTASGTLIKSVSDTWYEIVRYVGSDWSNAHKVPADKWEEIVAGAFTKADYESR